MGREVHVIPVPGGMTVEEAWLEITMLGYLVEQRTWWRRLAHRARHGRTRWAVIDVDDDG